MKLRSQKFCTLQHLKAMLPFQLWTLFFFSGITSTVWKAVGTFTEALFSFPERGFL